MIRYVLSLRRAQVFLILRAPPLPPRTRCAGETNVLLADIVVINKIDTADYGDILKVRGDHSVGTAYVRS